jgi:hypothetical protein
MYAMFDVAFGAGKVKSQLMLTNRFLHFIWIMISI